MHLISMVLVSALNKCWNRSAAVTGNWCEIQGSGKRHRLKRSQIANVVS